MREGLSAGTGLKRQSGGGARGAWRWDPAEQREEEREGARSQNAHCSGGGGGEEEEDDAKQQFQGPEAAPELYKGGVCAGGD